MPVWRRLMPRHSLASRGWALPDTPPAWPHRNGGWEFDMEAGDLEGHPPGRRRASADRASADSKGESRNSDTSDHWRITAGIPRNEGLDSLGRPQVSAAKAHEACCGRITPGRWACKSLAALE